MERFGEPQPAPYYREVLVDPIIEHIKKLWDTGTPVLYKAGIITAYKSNKEIVWRKNESEILTKLYGPK